MGSVEMRTKPCSRSGRQYQKLRAWFNTVGASRGRKREKYRLRWVQTPSNGELQSDKTQS